MRLAEHLLQAGDKDEARTVLEQGLEDYHYLSGPSRCRDRRWLGKARQLLKQAGGGSGPAAGRVIEDRIR